MITGGSQYPTFTSMENMYKYYYKDFNKSILTTGTANYLNTIFGGQAAINQNTETDAYAMYPKIPFDKSGFRFIPSLPQYTQTANVSKYGAVGETANFPEALTPPMQKVARRPKIHTQVIGNTAIAQWLATASKDDSIGEMNSLRLWMGSAFRVNMNNNIVRPFEEDIDNTKNADYSDIAFQNIETQDRIISSKAENDAVKAKHNNHTGYDNPWGDVNISRDTSTIFDAHVVSATGNAIDSGNEPLERSTFRKFQSVIAKRGGGVPSCYLTNWDVSEQIQGIYEDQTTQVLGEKYVEFDVGGVRGARGMQGGVQVASIYRSPIIISQHVRGYAGDSGEVGRLYAMDFKGLENEGRPRMAMTVAVPPQYGELGQAQGVTGMLALGQIGSKGAYITIQESICVRSVSQGKIRDIGV